jgi:hypothetical protein
MTGTLIGEMGSHEPLSCRHYQGKDPQTGFQMCRLRVGKAIQWCPYTLLGASAFCPEYVGPRGVNDVRREANRKKLIMARRFLESDVRREVAR